MIPDFPSRPSSSSTNFIKRNIQSCGSSSRLSSAPLTSTTGFGIRGIPLILRSKAPVRIKELNKEIPVNTQTFEIHEAKSKLSNLSKEPKGDPLIEDEQQKFGVRRTSIKPKQRRTVPLQCSDVKKLKKDKESIKDSRKSSSRGGTFSNREVLFLPITYLPAREKPRLPPQIFLQVTGQSVSRRGTELWEALESRLEKRRENSLERLLAAMEGQTKSEASAPHILNGKSRCPNGNSIGPEVSNLQNKTELDNSYHNVQQRHLENLTNVLLDQESIPEQQKIKQKKKLHPKLEIKIAGEVPRRDLDVNVVTAGLEEINVTEEIDNCGNLTPVITYNHVSTINPLEALVTASPSGSNKSSRSPSPLLEIPNKSGGKNTKRPPFNSVDISQAAAEMVEERKLCRAKLYQGIFQKHQQTLLAFSAFMRLLKSSKKKDYNQIE